MKKILVIASMILIWFSGAYAAGTPAGTQVQNSVTVSYSVALIPQTDIHADDGSGFVVDKMIDFTVANNDGNQMPVTPGQQDANTTWVLANTGNAAQYFTLAASNLTGSTIYSNADTANTETDYVIKYSTDSGVNWITYTTGAISLAADASVLVNVQSDIPLTVTNGQVMNIQLEATAVTDSGGATAEIATPVPILLEA